jgi:hypothetical protein
MPIFVREQPFDPKSPILDEWSTGQLSTFYIIGSWYHADPRYVIYSPEKLALNPKPHW